MSGKCDDDTRACAHLVCHAGIFQSLLRLKTDNIVSRRSPINLDSRFPLLKCRSLMSSGEQHEPKQCEAIINTCLHHNELGLTTGLPKMPVGFIGDNEKNKINNNSTSSIT